MALTQLFGGLPANLPASIAVELHRSTVPGELAEVLGRQALHARTLAFVHPATGEKLSFASELPTDMQAALTALRALPAAKGST